MNCCLKMNPLRQSKKTSLRLLALALLASPLASADQPTAAVLENDKLRMRLLPRTPAQISAFYEGRGFPPRALAALRETCFMTLGIRNRSKDVLWLDLARLTVREPSGKPVPILDRGYWQQRWTALNLPRGKQATFQWTLLPSQRDLQPDESVGGNLVIQRVSGPLVLEARFRTGKGQRGGEIIVQMEGIRCAN